MLLATPISNARLALGSIARWYWHLDPLAKWALGFLLSAVLGAGLGVLAEYSSYWFAIRCGFRPPVEGIPYIRVTVALVAAATVLGTALAGVSIFAIVALLLRRYEAGDSLETRMAILGSGLASLALAIGVMSILRVRPAVLWAAVLGGFVLLALAAVFGGLRTSKILGTLGSAFVLLGTPALLLHGNVYASLLRVLNFGGGQFVKVRFTDSTPALPGWLLLRSADAIFVLEEDRQGIREIRLAEVRSIHQPWPSAPSPEAHHRGLPEACAGWGWRSR